jgi:hypothetical protein
MPAEMEGRLLGYVRDPVQKLLGAGPADFHPAEQIGLGARHLEDALRPEMRLPSEDVGIGPEAHLGAAPVGRAAHLYQLALGMAALERHAVERLLARDLHLHALRQRIGDRNADAMQAAGRPIDLRVELAARMQGAHDHLERGLVLELGVRIDGNAAAVVGHRHEAVGLHFDFDEGGVALERLVHGIVDHLGKEVMQRLFVGAADIHARTPAHRLQTFKHLDVARGVTRLGPARGLGGARCLAGETARRGRQIREQVPVRFLGGGLGCCFSDLGHGARMGEGKTNQGVTMPRSWPHRDAPTPQTRGS